MNKKYNVKNRSASMAIYTIPEAGIRREFMPGETKQIPKTELDQLIFQPGGREILSSFLQVYDDEITKEYNIKTEPEYYMNEQQIVELIRTGELDAFLDCLDWAPIGVIDLIKGFAVSLPMTDTRKIEALKNKTGFDVEKALANKALEAEGDDVKEEPQKERRVQPATNEPVRRTTSKYKVVEK